MVSMWILWMGRIGNQIYMIIFLCYWKYSLLFSMTYVANLEYWQIYKAVHWLCTGFKTTVENGMVDPEKFQNEVAKEILWVRERIKTYCKQNKAIVLCQ